MMQTHPFLGQQTGQKVFKLVTSTVATTTAGTTTQRFAVRLQSSDPQEPVPTLDQAEDRVLARILAPSTGSTVMTLGAKASSIATEDGAVIASLIINRAANHVNAQAHRGAANLVLWNPSDLDAFIMSLAEKPMLCAVDESAQPIEGTAWRFLAYSATMRHLTSPKIPQGRAIVLYAGSYATDRLAIVLDAGDDHLFLNADDTGLTALENFAVVVDLG